VKIAHQETQESYGYIRLTKHLQSQGIKISQHAVRCIKKLSHLYCKRHKCFKITKNSDHNRSVYNNLLEQQFSMQAPNQAWVSDITYIWTAEGWLYLVALKDLYSKQVIGYSLSERMTTQPVCNALSMEIRNQKPPQNSTIHSDRGSQYCSHQYQDLLLRHGIQCSMSDKGLCYDNAVMERFFLNLKMERVWQQYYANHQEATKAISHYITVFYNQVRLHSTLGYISPYQFEQNTRKLPIEVSDFS
jgi:transposase InsO family protein